MTEKQFVHGEPHFYVNGVCSDVLNPAIKPVIDLSIGLCFARLHIFAHFLHTGGKAVFFLALSAFCASWRNLSGQSPSILLRKRELCSAKGMLEFRCKEKTAKQIKSTLPFYSNSTSSCNSNSVELHIANCCFNVPLISCLAIKKVLLLNTLH